LSGGERGGGAVDVHWSATSHHRELRIYTHAQCSIIIRILLLLLLLVVVVTRDGVARGRRRARRRGRGRGRSVCTGGEVARRQQDGDQRHRENAAPASAAGHQLHSHHSLLDSNTHTHTHDYTPQLKCTTPNELQTTPDSLLLLTACNRERKCAENYNKWHDNLSLNCNQHFGNFKP